MSDHAIGILVGALLVTLFIALVLLHRKDRRDRKFGAEMEQQLRRTRKVGNPNAWGDVKPRRYKR